VHYDFLYGTAGFRRKPLHAAAENLASSATPARMQQGHAGVWCDQVHRHAIGNGHREQSARRGADPAVDSFNLYPAGAARSAGHVDTMDLISQDHSVESRKGVAEGTPTAQDVADRLGAPETEIKITPRDTGRHSKLFFPTGDFESRNGTGNR
jgi:hypothetical protein